MKRARSAVGILAGSAFALGIIALGVAGLVPQALTVSPAAAAPRAGAGSRAFDLISVPPNSSAVISVPSNTSVPSNSAATASAEPAAPAIGDATFPLLAALLLGLLCFFATRGLVERRLRN